MKKSLTPEMIEWAYEQWCIGSTYSQIAAALYVSERTIRKALKGRPRIRPVLHYDFENKGD